MHLIVYMFTCRMYIADDLKKNYHGHCKYELTFIKDMSLLLEGKELLSPLSISLDQYQSRAYFSLLQKNPTRSSVIVTRR